VAYFQNEEESERFDVAQSGGDYKLKVPLHRKKWSSKNGQKEK